MLPLQLLMSKTYNVNIIQNRLQYSYNLYQILKTSKDIRRETCYPTGNGAFMQMLARANLPRTQMHNTYIYMYICI